MERAKKMRQSLLFIALIMIGLTARGQFYNGLQMEFGKNRIQYAQSDILESDFYYSFFRFNQFDVYFNPDGQELAEYVGRKSFQELALLENYFEHSLSKRIIFLVYNKLTDFRQSNIGLVTGQESTNIGGTTRLLDNKVFLYFDGSHEDLDEQIRAAIAQVILDEMLYLGNVRERVTSSTLLNLPEWFSAGLISYVSKEWDIETDNLVKDGILSGRFEKFNRLTGEEATYAGHSLWYFIAEEFGESVIPNIIYFTKINRNGSSGFLNVLGVPLNALTYEWLHFFKERYGAAEHQGNGTSVQQVPVKNRKHRRVLRTQISPDGTKMAYSTIQKGQIRVFLHDELSGKTTQIYKQGAKLQQIEDESIPSFAWHPSGQLLALCTEYKGMIRFSLYPLAGKKWEHQELIGFEKVLDFDYADDGLSIVLSGVMKGRSDIFVHNLVAHTNERITDDLADDFNPRFVDQSNSILFSSNRLTDSLSAEEENMKLAPSLDLFVYDYKGYNDRLVRIAANRYVDRLKPLEVADQSFVFLGDDSGIRNLYSARYDSAIAYIDTTTHYRYFTRTSPLSRYDRNILDHSYSDESRLFGQAFLKNNKYLVQKDEARLSSENLTQTVYRRKLTQSLIRKDSLKALREEQIRASQLRSRQVFNLGGDSLAPEVKKRININNYVLNKSGEPFRLILELVERLREKGILSQAGNMNCHHCEFINPLFTSIIWPARSILAF